MQENVHTKMLHLVVILLTFVNHTNIFKAKSHHMTNRVYASDLQILGIFHAVVALAPYGAC